MGPLSALRITLEHGVIFNDHVEMKPRNISSTDRMEKKSGRIFEADVMVISE
jgi:hypothetical protein|tara:strand:+ start:429 stop:584 length:156 start_codon:yes stop_codon:yes gene_type:complete